MLESAGILVSPAEGEPGRFCLLRGRCNGQLGDRSEGHIRRRRLEMESNLPVLGRGTAGHRLKDGNEQSQLVNVRRARMDKPVSIHSWASRLPYVYCRSAVQACRYSPFPEPLA